MAELNEETIKKLTELSRIRCSQEERSSLLADLQKILNYIDQLNEIDTSGVLSCDNILEMVNVMRDDVVGHVLPQKVFLDNAPAHTGGMIRVPPVLKSQ